MLTIFLARVIFLIHHWWKKIKKKAGAKKLFLSKNHWHHACQPCIGIFEVAIIFSDFSARASDCSGSNLVSHWCLKMKSRGLYHAYRLWKSGLLLDLQQVGPPYCVTVTFEKGWNYFSDFKNRKPTIFFFQDSKYQKAEENKKNNHKWSLGN